MDDIKSLVVGEKWLATVWSSIQAEIDYISQNLDRRVRELAKRYAEPLPSLTVEVESLHAKVLEHLSAMEAVCT
ncbi:MAG: hypothetical protein AB8B91_13440 [Rubripirellula sp.]